MKSLFDRFNEKLVKVTESGCWIWVGACNSAGYGHMKISRENILSHRLSYSMFNGDIEDDLLVLHRCDVRCCVNPNHLFLGTQKDNVQDMINKGRRNGAKGETAWKNKLTEKEVKEIFKDKRQQKDIAFSYGVKPNTISQIKSGNSWKYLNLTQSQT